jgi:hypothetical protein
MHIDISPRGAAPRDPKTAAIAHAAALENSVGTYRHTLHPTGRDYLPARVLCVASAAPPRPRIRRQWAPPIGLRPGAAVLLSLRGGREWTRDVYRLDGPADLLRVIDRVCRGRHRLWVVACGMSAELDNLGIRRLLLGGEFRLQAWVEVSPPVVIYSRRHDAQVIWCDSCNWVCAGIDGLATLLGRDASGALAGLGEGADPLRAARARAHLVADTLAGWVAACARVGRLTWGATGAAVGWSSWLQSGAGRRVHVHDHARALKCERAAYFGGRLDCRIIGSVKGEIHHVDANSLYPWSAAHQDLPVRLIGPAPKSATGLSAAVRAGYLVVCRVVLRTGGVDYPFRREHRAQHGRGEFATCLATPELARALAAGAVSGIGEGYLYEPGRPLTAWVDRVYGARLAAREQPGDAAASILKSLLVGCIGRFGRWAYDWQPCDRYPGGPLLPIGVWHHHTPQGPVTHRFLGRAVERLGARREWAHSVPAIAAHVTSYARVYVDLMVEIAGAGNVLYQDTDALHLTAEGMRRLEAVGGFVGAGLGQLKLVEVGDGATYYGVRHYQIGERYVRSGLHCPPTEEGGRSLADGARPVVPDRYRGRVTRAGWVQPLEDYSCRRED